MTSIDMQSVAPIARSLRDDEIHVWRVAYHREQKRAPLLALLGFYLGVATDKIELVDGEHGRPEFGSSHDGSLGFNWSHSGELAVVAVARHLLPGIDIEIRRDRPRAMDIASHYFCAEELAALTALPAAARGEAFLDLWTAKEAVLKALGRGIAFGLDRLNISRTPELSLRWLDDDDARSWQLHRLDVDEGYLAALAWRGPKRTIRRWAIACRPDCTIFATPLG